MVVAEVVGWCLECGMWVDVGVAEVAGEVSSGRDGVVGPDPGSRPLGWPRPVPPGLSSSEWIMSGASMGW